MKNVKDSHQNYIISDHLIYNINFDDRIERILNDFRSSMIFHKTLKEYTPSPIYSLSGVADQLGVGEIIIKNEAERFGISAIKMLGASYAMQILVDRNPAIKSFCTATDGNHGRSVAWSARRLRMKAVIFVPSYTIEERIRNIELERARVIRVNGNYDDAVAAAMKFSKDNESVLIQDMALPGYLEIPALITSGYYTQMNEILTQLDCEKDPVDIIFLQSGNGSWPSAVTHFVRKHTQFSSTKIVIVEPRNSDCLFESLKKSKLCSTVKNQHTIMAGLNCGTPSILAFEILRSGVNASMVIDDEYAVKAMKKLYHPLPGDPKIESGESGAAGLAGLLAMLSDSKYGELKTQLNINSRSRILVFNTEGITNPKLFNRIMD